MPDPVIEFDHVYKKFARGEQHNSLRDFIPAMARKLLRRNRGSEVELGAREFWAVQDVSFRLNKGESMGIIGPNGSGKSTTLKLLSGILRAERGSYRVRGRLSALIEVGAGFHPDLTGRENVYLNGSILGMTRKEISAKFNQIVEFAGVEEFIDTPVKYYSSGMSVRLGFATSAFIEPDVLLVDEVLAVGDTEFRNRCMSRMNQMLAGGVTMILVSHNLTEVRNLCQNCLMLYKGQTQMQGQTPKVIAEYHRIVGEKIRLEQEKHAAAEAEAAAAKKRDAPCAIVGAELFNAAGERCDVYGTTDAQTLRIHYDARRRLETPHFNVELIWAAEGYMGAACSTWARRVQLGPIEGRGYVDLKIKALLVEPNVYAWSIAVGDGSGVVLDTLKRVRFAVQEREPIPGLFGLEHEWGRPVPEEPSVAASTTTDHLARPLASGVQVPHLQEDQPDAARGSTELAEVKRAG